VNGDARVVEIGSGPVGVVAHFPASDRLAVDPLDRFFAGNEVFTQLRNPQVRYLEGVGEHLPSTDVSCDLVIMENCIDHVRDMGAVMKEIRRVLAPNGVLYLTVNCRSSWGYWMHRALSRLLIDSGHPHTFTLPRLRCFVVQQAFEILSIEAESQKAARLTDLTAQDTKARLKGLLGVSEFLATVLAQRPVT
jgi:ubiquinone/menaquinone biosynthesis C-methylase UbiE